MPGKGRRLPAHRWGTVVKRVPRSKSAKPVGFGNAVRCVEQVYLDIPGINCTVTIQTITESIVEAVQWTGGGRADYH